MSYKNKIAYKLNQLQKGEDDFLDVFGKLFKAEYIKAIEEAKVTGQSIQSVSYEFLEAIEEIEGIKKVELLDNVTHMMLAILYKNADISIQKSAQQVTLAHNELQETIDREKSHLLELLETLKSYAQERYFQNLKKTIDEKEIRLSEWFEHIKNKTNKMQGGGYIR